MTDEMLDGLVVLGLLLLGAALGGAGVALSDTAADTACPLEGPARASVPLSSRASPRRRAHPPTAPRRR